MVNLRPKSIKTFRGIFPFLRVPTYRFWALLGKTRAHDLLTRPTGCTITVLLCIFAFFLDIPEIGSVSL